MRRNSSLRESGCIILSLLLLLSALGFPTAAAQEASAEGLRESYIVDGLFSFTPREFLSRLQNDLEKSYPDCSITPQGGMMYHISWEEDQDSTSYVTFFRKDKSAIPCDDPDSTDVWCIMLSNVSYVLPLGCLTPRNTFEAFLYSVDPAMDSDLSFNLWTMKLTSSLNATLEDPPKYWGYAYENDILYEFGFETMDKNGRQAESTQDAAIAYECVGLYASNWLAE